MHKIPWGAVGAAFIQALGNGKTVLGLRYEGQRNYFNTDETASSEPLIGVVSYEFKSNLQGRLLAGRDWLKSATREFDEQNTVYCVGITWQPTRQLYIDVEYQE